MLSYKQFKKKAEQDFISYLPQEFSKHSISSKEVSKVNETKDAIIISKESDTQELITPVFYFQDMYKEYRRTGLYEETLQLFSDLYISSLNTKLPNLCTADLEEVIKEKTVLQLVNAEDNFELSLNCPYLPFLDLFIIFRVVFSIQDDGISSFILTNELCESYKLDLDELFGIAYSNTIKMLGHEERTMKEILIEATTKSGINKKEAQKMISKSPFGGRSDRILIITDRYKFIGANLMLFPNYLKNLSDKYDSSLLIIPSSIRDLIIIPEMDFFEVDEIKHSILEINKVKLEPEDRLSDSLYLFDRDRKEILIVHGVEDYEE